MKHKVVACLPVKDEEEFIEKVLKTLDVYCDKIVILDDFSTDRTEEICKSFEKVAWYRRGEHHPDNKQEGIQKSEMMELTRKFEPDYILCLDGDEIPTPSIVDFINNIDENVTIWGSRMINLWGGENQYRCDRYTTKFNTNVNWDPWNNPWVKHVLMKYRKDMVFTYNTSINHGGLSDVHPFPDSIDGVVRFTDDYHIIHYGKLRSKYLSGELLKSYAKFDEYGGKGTYESRLDWHLEHNRTDTLKLENTKEEWIWKV